jgi:hypothetical protein
MKKQLILAKCVDKGSFLPRIFVQKLYRSRVSRETKIVGLQIGDPNEQIRESWPIRNPEFGMPGLPKVHDRITLIMCRWRRQNLLWVRAK